MEAFRQSRIELRRGLDASGRQSGEITERRSARRPPDGADGPAPAAFRIATPPRRRRNSRLCADTAIAGPLVEADGALVVLAHLEPQRVAPPLPARRPRRPQAVGGRMPRTRCRARPRSNRAAPCGCPPETARPQQPSQRCRPLPPPARRRCRCRSGRGTPGGRYGRSSKAAVLERHAGRRDRSRGPGGCRQALWTAKTSIRRGGVQCCQW